MIEICACVTALPLSLYCEVIMTVDGVLDLFWDLDDFEFIWNLYMKQFLQYNNKCCQKYLSYQALYYQTIIKSTVIGDSVKAE